LSTKESKGARKKEPDGGRLAGGGRRTKNIPGSLSEYMKKKVGG